MDHELGLAKLKEHASGKDWFQDFTLYEARLRENLRDERRFGPSEQIRADRARVVDQLNALAMQHLGKSFNELAMSNPGSSGGGAVTPSQGARPRPPGDLRLTGPQSRALSEALLDAFPSRGDLEQMLHFHLDKSLSLISGQGNMRDVVFDLMTAARAEGWLADLIVEAHRCRPGNGALIAFMRQVGLGEWVQGSSS